MTPVVELIAACKRYGTVEALRGVDLCIRPGAAVALLGPNGAGKTTTISFMLGLCRPPPVSLRDDVRAISVGQTRGDTI